MFHIEPTPLSWMLWLLIWAAAIIGPILVGVIVYLVVKGKNGARSFASVVTMILLIISILIASGLSISSYYHNYTHSASYIKDKKAKQIEYDTQKQVRNIKVLDYTGKTIYDYTGKFSFDRSGQGLNLVDNVTGKKISVYIGDNDTVLVTDN